MAGIEEYAIKTGKFHPKLVKFARRFVSIDALTRARVKVLKNESAPSGRAKKEGQRRSRTPAFVLLDRTYWGRGVLNKPGVHAGNSFDLSTPSGMALFLHEAYHVEQYLRSGVVRTLLNYLRAVLESLIRRRILWAHELIPFEVEAIRKQRAWQDVLEREGPELLAQFVDLR
ncbi:MAG: hypothetical protein Kow0069_24970 [Promethearchaeota archaeon]